jgi:hypothetical protein
LVTATTQKRNGVSRVLFTTVLAIPALAGVIWDEVLLAGPIIFLVKVLGFWLAYFVFCALWAGLGLFLLLVWLRVEPWVREHFLGPKKIAETSSDNLEQEKARDWRERVALSLAKIAKILGALTAGVLLGPVFGWPLFKLLGYNQKQVVGLTISASFIFGAIWVPFYGLGVWGLGLSRLF